MSSGGPMVACRCILTARRPVGISDRARFACMRGGGHGRQPPDVHQRRVGELVRRRNPRHHQPSLGSGDRERARGHGGGHEPCHRRCQDRVLRRVVRHDAEGPPARVAEARRPHRGARRRARQDRVGERRQAVRSDDVGGDPADRGQPAVLRGCGAHARGSKRRRVHGRIHVASCGESRSGSPVSSPRGTTRS